MMIEGAGKFTFIMGSDIERNGMFLEMLSAEGVYVAEVFHSDVTSEMVVTMQGHVLPIEALEELLSQARLRLPPKEKVGFQQSP